MQVVEELKLVPIHFVGQDKVRRLPAGQPVTLATMVTKRETEKEKACTHVTTFSKL